MCFSRKQQQVLGVFCLLFGIWLVSFAYHDSRNVIESSRLVDPDPPELIFYIIPPIDINTANSEELQLLPSIGSAFAERIVAYRERYGAFRSLSSLRNIHGIGPKTLQKLEYYLTFPEK